LEAGSFAIYIEGTDGDEDLTEIAFQLFTAEGENIPEELYQTPLSHMISEDGHFKAWFHLVNEGIAQVAIGGIAIAIDAAGNQSESMDLQEATTEAADGFCDPNRTVNFCEVGLCNDFVCVAEPDAACPGEWEVMDLSTMENWIYEGSTDGSEDYTGGASCGGGVAQNIFAFTAPSADYYSFTTSVEGENDDTVLYIRDYCNIDDSSIEVGCNDDRLGGGYASQLNVELEAEQTVFVFVDGYKNPDAPWSGNYRLDAKVAHPPVLENVEAYMSGSDAAQTLAIRGSGTDSDDNTSNFHLILLDNEGNAVSQLIESSFDQADFATLNLNGDGSYDFSMVVDIDFTAAQIEIGIGDSDGGWSELLTVPVEAPSAVAIGEACERGFDICEEESVCVAPLDLPEGEEPTEFFCRLLHPPVLDNAELYHRDAHENEERDLWALQVMGSDEDNNIVAVSISFINEAGEPIALDLRGNTELAISFIQSSMVEGTFTGLSYFGQFEEAISVRFALIDRDGQRSEPSDINFADAITGAEVAEGESCDPGGVVSSCVDEFYCTENICAAETPCPEGWNIVDINTEAVDGELAGSSVGSEVELSASCGGGAGAAVFSFTAEEAGVYTFRADYEYTFCSGPESDECDEGVECGANLPMPDSPPCESDEECGPGAACLMGMFGGSCSRYICGQQADTFMYARSVCNTEDYRAELGCNDDTNDFLAQVSFPLEEGQTSYIFVEGYQSQLDFIIRYAQAAPPLLGQVEAFYSEESRELGIHVLGSDEEDDIVAVKLELLDAEGNPLDIGGGEEPELFVELNFRREEAEEFDARTIFSVPAELSFAEIRVSLKDATDQYSETIAVVPVAPQIIEPNAECDPGFTAFAHCGELVCIDMDGIDEEGVLEPICVEIEASCSDATWTMEELVGNASSSVSAEGEGVEGAQFFSDGMSCGRLNEGAWVAGFTFTAPAAGDYFFYTQVAPGGIDTVLSLRSHCDHMQLELACSDDGLNLEGEGLPDASSSITQTMVEGEMVYLFVGAYQNSASGEFELFVEAL